MCSQFSIRYNQTDLFAALEFLSRPPIKFNQNLTFEKPSHDRVFPGSLAPVIKKNSDVEFSLMRFGLVPRWSKDPKPAFATHNARIETVLEKPSWKVPFKSNHCVIPLSAFYESVYLGPFAGNTIQIRCAKHKESILFAAGIWDEWIDKNSGETLESFAIVTRPPYPKVQAAGHDRSPVFLNSKDILAWLNLSGDGGVQREGLEKIVFNPDFEIEIEKPLKAGWEKRIPKK